MVVLTLFFDCMRSLCTCTGAEQQAIAASRAACALEQAVIKFSFLWQAASKGKHDDVVEPLNSRPKFYLS